MRKILLAVLISVVGISFSGAALAQENSPAATIEKLHGALLEVMKQAKKLGYAGRLEALSPVLDEVYGFGDMIRVATGDHWKGFNEAQKTTLVQVYAKMSKSTYAARFNGYEGERFETLETVELPPPAKGVLITTRIVMSGDKKPVVLKYQLRNSGGKWRIVDVYYSDGAVSELATQKSQYVGVIDRETHAGLVKRLDEQADKLAK
jgi:phospholipid transport system substrate-binding protein